MKLMFNDSKMHHIWPELVLHVRSTENGFYDEKLLVLEIGKISQYFKLVVRILVY